MIERIRNTQYAICYGLLVTFVAFPLLLLWRPLFAGEAFFWGTPLLQFIPWQRMAATMWRGGHLPLWNPLLGCGAPLAANYQAGAFYPLNLLYLLLPAEVALSWTIAFHLTLAGWGMYGWCRAVGLDRLPALLGALSLSGSGFLVARVALFPSIAFTFPWLAVWLWRAELLVQRRRLSDVLWLGFALGLGLLAGHAQTAFYGGVLLVAYLAFRTIQEARGRGAGSNTQYAIHNTLLVGLAFILGAGLAAVQLLPTAELMNLSQRSTGVDYGFGMTYSLWPWRLITFFAPDFFGNPGRGDYWGYATYWEDAGYVGLLPLLLAIAAVGSLMQHATRSTQHATRNTFHVGRRSMIGFWTISAVVALVLALGKNTPLFPFLFRHIPSFNLFQAPARWLAVTTVALTALAALGAHSWPVGHRGRRPGALGLVVGLALALGGLAAPVAVPGIPATFGPATVRLGGMLAAAGALSLLRRDAAWWRVAVGAFVALDLLVFGWPLIPTVDRSLYQDAAESAVHLEYEPGPAARVYWPTDPNHLDREHDAEYRVKFRYLTFDDFGPRDVGYWWEMRESLLPNAGMLDGVASANNFDPLLVGRYADLLEAAVETPALLRVMGVTHVASDRPWPGGEPAYESGTLTLYRLPDGLGCAWVVPTARQVSPDEALTALADPAFDPAAEVLLERPVSDAQYSASGIQYQVTLQDTPNRVTIRAILDAPGYLVLADVWYPGWRATVDGEPAEILRANYTFRAVWLKAGEHTVEMIYRPLSVVAGGVISLVTLLLLLVGLAVAHRQEARA
ncbi:MAG: YfhO family protein [Anaerolineae bacterium]